MDYGPRYLGTAVLSASILVLTAIGRMRWRQGGRKGVLIALCGYNALLMALFILGLLADDGFGWAFLPLFLCAAPWSFLISTVLSHGAIADWFASGLIGNFVLLVGICGGINSVLLYLLITRAFYPKPLKTPPLTS